MKERLDVILVKKGLFETREKAKRSIMSGIVYVNNQKEDKAGSRFDTEALFEVRGPIMPYVSRGGLKIEKAFKYFNINPEGKICIDIGASTGGFTDCLLQNAAKRVYSIDVGYGQLAWKLRTDDRVVNIERTNFRYIENEKIPESIDLAVTDVSFISLTKIIPKALELLKEGGEFICLIKPQFEAGKDKVGKKGVIRDRNVHKEVLQKILRFSNDSGLYINGLTFSPIKGPEGNIEFLLYTSLLDKKNADSEIEELITDTINGMEF